MDKPDFESTTAILRRKAPGLAWLPSAFRQRLTPAALGSAVTALAIAIAYVVNAQHDIHSAQKDIRQLNETVTEQQKQLELLHKIDTQLAVMSSQVGTIADEVERQREWRDRIEGVAELPTRAFKRKTRN